MKFTSQHSYLIAVGERFSIDQGIASKANGRMPALVAMVLMLGLVALGWGTSQYGDYRLFLTLGLVGLMVGLAVVAPHHLLYSLIVWLGVLGLLRRLISSIVPRGEFDSLLLVAPIGLALLALAGGQRGAFRDRTKLATSVAALMGLTLLGAVNPVQQNISLGVSGLLFVLVPMLGFWVGRGLCDDHTLVTVFKLFGALAIPTALYGINQTLSGFPNWDEVWIRGFGYVALNVRGVVRPFSTFSSAAEYGFYLGVAIVIWIVFGLSSAKFGITLLVVGLLGWALLLEASRQVLVTLLIALGILAATKMKMRPLQSFILGIAFLVFTGVLFARFQGSLDAQSAPGALISHQVRGLANPLDARESTLGVHLDLVWTGLRSAVTHPLGQGLGVITIGADRFGVTRRDTETDLSNAALALGLPGLIAYAALAFCAFQLALRLLSERRDRLALASVGILVVMVFKWTAGGQYAVAFLPWLILGWMDRARLSRYRSPDTADEGPQSYRGCSKLS